MTLTWAQSITQYSPMEAVDINEIRTNADTVVNNISAYCATHFSGYCGSYLTSVRYTHYLQDWTTHNFGHNAGHMSSVQGTNIS